MLSLDIMSLQQAYTMKSVTPSQVVEKIYDRIEARGEDGVWISVVPRESALQRAHDLTTLEEPAKKKLPLFGLPFSVKDCIDVADMPTTAGCPEFAYIAKRTNLAIKRALEAGAILIGKTNLDQFATGLVGVRTPYGVAENPFNPDLIPGGSSSGAAVSVATGLVSFAFGTDTGGSGRIPAGFNNIIGLKPTMGLLSRTDMTNACRTLDTVSIFALTAPDALEVLNVCIAKDPDDPYGRSPPDARLPAYCDNASFTFAVPQENQRQFFGNKGAETLFKEAIAELTRMGGKELAIDYGPFLETNAF
ncbi:MAG: allophanate hydrolase, partial [Rhodospirillaceae bacterium]|nr:allophanate hydrolase [Rhodospirillaceae bacterium]